MDIATVIGLVAGFGLIVISIGASQLIYFVDIPSVEIVIGGTAACFAVNYPLKDLVAFATIVKKVFLYKTVSPDQVIPQILDFAGRARRDGILALQSVIGSVEEPFLQKGIQLAIDGTEPQAIMTILETEVEYVKERHRLGMEMLQSLGSLAPAMGMIGTLIGLVLMLQSLDDPSTIGPAMAVALITTFYGALMANLMFLPMAGKLKKRAADESLIQELIIEGVISITNGDNPRIIEQKLNAYLLPKQRKNHFE
ncbi:MAG: MotA/TolQ/ExbB proton channel family protein [Nitrospinae bacterium]|nr:MotA/TolQ/ExbB proton channel family protein [Nitrospinota bacterium]